MTGADTYDLERFVQAQAPVFETALAELRAGRKRSHWMWFVFPQLKGLGRSPTAQFYGISCLDEARAYLGHAELGPRLRTAAHAVLDGPEQDLGRLFGAPDDAKFISCMSLFARAKPDGVFSEALSRWNGGRLDPLTARLLDDGPA
jgi:uncharacterized protein (DUF1810 family)